MPDNLTEKVDELFALLTEQGQGDYMGERVSQLQHSLQAAELAMVATRDEETILAALLHDIGRFIPAAKEAQSLIAPNGQYVGKAGHETMGARYLRQLGFSEKVCALVGAHVEAKRYLAAVDEAYYDKLSSLSKHSLALQGGPMSEGEITKARLDPLLEQKLMVRTCDDRAKDPMRDTHGLEFFKPIAIAHLRVAGCT